MHVPLDPSSAAPNRGPRIPLSVSPIYEREGGRVVRAGVLAIAEGLVAPRPFWAPLRRLAARGDWLRATFALASRPACYGVARADGGAPAAGFCGTWRSTPRLTLIVAGKDVAPAHEIESDLTACLSTAVVGRDDDPFPRWQPGDPWRAVFWEGAC